MYPAELVLTVYLAQYLCRILKPTKYEGGWLLTSPSESSRKSIDCEPPEIVADATNFVLREGEGPVYYGAASIEEKQVLTKRSKNRETTGTGTTTDKSKIEEK